MLLLHFWLGCLLFLCIIWLLCLRLSVLCWIRVVWVGNFTLFLILEEKLWIFSIILAVGFSGGSDGKESTCNSGDLGSIPGLGRSPGGGHGNALQYSCLKNPQTEQPGELQSMGLQKVRLNWVSKHSIVYDVSYRFATCDLYRVQIFLLYSVCWVFF